MDKKNPLKSAPSINGIELNCNKQIAAEKEIN